MAQHFRASIHTLPCSIHLSVVCMLMLLFRSLSRLDDPFFSNICIIHSVVIQESGSNYKTNNMDATNKSKRMCSHKATSLFYFSYASASPSACQQSSTTMCVFWKLTIYLYIYFSSPFVTREMHEFFTVFEFWMIFFTGIKRKKSWQKQQKPFRLRGKWCSYPFGHTKEARTASSMGWQIVKWLLLTKLNRNSVTIQKNRPPLIIFDFNVFLLLLDKQNVNRGYVCIQHTLATAYKSEIYCHIESNVPRIHWIMHARSLSVTSHERSPQSQPPPPSQITLHGLDIRNAIKWKCNVWQILFHNYRWLLWSSSQHKMWNTNK